jgi:hypothetical protein
VLDARRALFLRFYFNPESNTFNKLKASGQKAGYTSGYISQIRRKKWFKRALRQVALIDKSEKKLAKILDYKVDEVAIGKDGKEELDEEGNVIIYVRDHKTLKIQSDVSKFSLERLDKEKYSPRSEIVGDENKPIMINVD